MAEVKTSFRQDWAVTIGEGREQSIKVSGTVGSDRVTVEMHDPDVGFAGGCHESNPQTVTKNMHINELRELMIQVEQNAGRRGGHE
jgi:hypothetical protein